MSKSNTHFCDFCHNEMWGENVITYHGHEFCSQECIDGFFQEAGF